MEAFSAIIIIIIIKVNAKMEHLKKKKTFTHFCALKKIKIN